jgi:hypothetical protein
MAPTAVPIPPMPWRSGPFCILVGNRTLCEVPTLRVYAVFRSITPDRGYLQRSAAFASGGPISATMSARRSCGRIRRYGSAAWSCGQEQPRRLGGLTAAQAAGALLRACGPRRRRPDRHRGACRRTRSAWGRIPWASWERPRWWREPIEHDPGPWRTRISGPRWCLAILKAILKRSDPPAGLC